jgi:hypothetical protein
VADHPVKVPPELVASLRNSAPHGIRDAGVTRELWLINSAYAAGADQELRVCCDAIYLHEGRPLCGGTAEWLRSTRRPKPPSLAEQAKAELDDAVMRGDCITTTDAMPSLRAALQRLKELEAHQ